MLGKLVFAQQDAQFSQYMFNGIYINPAYAGYKEVLNLHGYYRAQWTGIEGAPRSFSLAMDGVTNDGNVGLALQVASDKLGAQSTQSVYGSYAYRIRMNEDGTARLAFGISGGIVQLGINGALLSTQDPELDMPAGTQSTIVPDARAGVYYADQRFYAGFSVDNLISPHINKSRYVYIPQPKPHYYFTAGMLFPLSEQVQFKPSFLLKDDRGGPTSLDVNAFILFRDKIWIGGSYRTRVDLYSKDYLQKSLVGRNAAVAAVEIFPVPSLRIGYAYDFSIGPLESYSNGSHELSIGFLFLSSGGKAKRDLRVSCPKFF
ncbi:type IX secretion system membrane protein PorP/SprF [Chitinophaga japonensis]